MRIYIQKLKENDKYDTLYKSIILNIIKTSIIRTLNNAQNLSITEN